MNRFVITGLALLSLISSCKKSDKEDVLCDDAILNLCNTTKNEIVVYGIGTNQVTDTLFPGECDEISFGRLVIRYDDRGELAYQEGGGPILYNTNNGSYYIGVEECYVTMEAPSGHINVEHCYNGVFDPKEGELNTDCGGNCKPCGDFQIPCDSTLEDGFKWDYLSQPMSFPSTYFGDQLNNKGIIRFTFGNGDVFELAIPATEIPDKSEKFIVGPEYYKAEAWFTDRYGNFRRTVQDSSLIYLEVDNAGKKTVKFCDVDFKLANGNTFQASAKLEID